MGKKGKKVQVDSVKMTLKIHKMLKAVGGLEEQRAVIMKLAESRGMEVSLGTPA